MTNSMKTTSLSCPRSALLVFLVVFGLAGCTTYVTQTTSGQDYLSQYPTQMGEGAAGSASDLNQEVREVAAVEPLLRFPARIGLAKLHNGQMVNLAPEEAEVWAAVRERLGEGFGEFVPVSALIAESVYTAPEGINSKSAKEVIRKLRLGAARQHLDAILVYEVFSETNRKTLPTAVSDWTIIGAYFVPSREVEVVGYANALLLDVRNGYPYGTASASATEKDITTAVASWDMRSDLEGKTHVGTAVQLVPEVEKMMAELMAQLPKSSEESALDTAD